MRRENQDAVQPVDAGLGRDVRHQIGVVNAESMKCKGRWRTPPTTRNIRIFHGLYMLLSAFILSGRDRGVVEILCGLVCVISLENVCMKT